MGNETDANICIKILTKWHIVTFIGLAVYIYLFTVSKKKTLFKTTLTEQ